VDEAGCTLGSSLYLFVMSSLCYLHHRHIASVFSRSIHVEADTQADIAVTVFRRPAVTKRRTAVAGLVVPGTAAQRSELSFIRAFRIDHVFLRIVADPVLAPLVDVAMHV